MEENFAGFFLLTLVQEEWKKNFAGFFLLVDGIWGVKLTISTFFKAKNNIL